MSLFLQVLNTVLNVLALGIIVWLVRDRRILASANIALARRMALLEKQRIEYDLPPPRDTPPPMDLPSSKGN